MEHDQDLGLAIVRYATSCRRKISPAEFVKSILLCGQTSAYKFCNEHMQKDGWKSTYITPPPKDKMVLACEELGDQTEAMLCDGERWFRIGRRATVAVSYIPGWWQDDATRVIVKQEENE